MKNVPSDAQKDFGALTRGRRTKLARLANTTLVKADQWARGESVPADVADALAKELAAIKSKGKK